MNLLSIKLKNQKSFLAISKFIFGFYAILLIINFLNIAMAQNAHQFSFNLANNKQIHLSDLRGKVILIVNTASKCGLTPQYSELENIYQKYKDQGLVIIGVPSGNFANQEFSNIKQVTSFAKQNYHISFNLSTISDVIGQNAHPFYQWANKQATIIGSPKWNFHKYLIDKNGNFAGWFSSVTKPQSKKFIDKIEELLNQKSDHQASNLKNVLGTNLQECCLDPITGFYRNGLCQTDQNDHGRHTVCAIVTEEFLQYSKSQGNDLITPNMTYNFPGLKAGDKWCLCAMRFKEAVLANKAPKVILEATHEKTLKYIDLNTLKKYQYKY